MFFFLYSPFFFFKLIKKFISPKFYQNKFILNTKNSGISEISGEKIKINNSKWECELNHLLSKVKIHFGFQNDSTTIKLKSLLITGKEFDEKHFLEENKNILATLFIQLPSIYTGK